MIVFKPQADIGITVDNELNDDPHGGSRGVEKFIF